MWRWWRGMVVRGCEGNEMNGERVRGRKRRHVWIVTGLGPAEGKEGETITGTYQ